MASKPVPGTERPATGAAEGREYASLVGRVDPPRLRRRELAVYLNDHLAGAEAGRRLAGRVAHLTDPDLQGLDREIERDYSRLRQLFDELGISRSRVKRAGGIAAETLSRIKLRLGSAGVRDVEQLLGLEALAVGVAGKLRLWRALESIAASDPRLDAGELRALGARAEAQLDAIEQVRLRAAQHCLTEKA
jgi:hypothetical protein